jgi:hypothetical protein
MVVGVGTRRGRVTFGGRPFYLVPAVAVRQVVLAFYGLIRCKEWFMKVS